MFHELLRITQTDQVLKRHNLDTPDYLELSRLGASLLLTLYTDLPVAKTTPSVFILVLYYTYLHIFVFVFVCVCVCVCVCVFLFS